MRSAPTPPAFLPRQLDGSRHLPSRGRLALCSRPRESGALGDPRGGLQAGVGPPWLADGMAERPGPRRPPRYSSIFISILLFMFTHDIVYKCDCTVDADIKTIFCNCEVSEVGWSLCVVSLATSMRVCLKMRFTIIVSCPIDCCLTLASTIINSCQPGSGSVLELEVCPCLLCVVLHGD